LSLACLIHGLLGAVYTTIPAGGGATSTTTLYYALDHLGSIAATVVSDGTARTLRSYDNWGTQRFPSGADDTANTLWSQNAEVRGFLGQEQVAQIGLINLNARMYDPWLGRLLQVDPIIGSIYNLQGLNPYSYVMNNPLTDSDPFGLCGFFCSIGKGVGSFLNHAVVP
jgi:RHS repeat-associated protein